MPAGSVVFLHRQKHDSITVAKSQVEFARPWVDYKNGFESPDMNYWMGLDRLHTLTSSRAYGLRVDMTVWHGRTFWAEYDRFRVGPESGNYTLSVGGYDRYSTVTDEMWHHNGMMFSTYDRDNDRWSEGNCARDRYGGWWYKDCYFERPTGLYLSGGVCSWKGFLWWITPGYYCIYYSFKRMTFTLIPTVHSEPVVTTTSMSTEPVVTTTSMPAEPVVFLHRQDASVSFTRPWVDYKNGFGSPDTNYWMGLHHIHTLTSSKAYRLRVDMTDWVGKKLWAGYDRFSVGPESSNYTLNVTGYDSDSTVPDEMQYQNGMMFSTYDRDNDGWRFNCARYKKGGWWYERCFHVSPTGLYLKGGGCSRKGTTWWNLPDHYCRFYSFKRMTFTLIPTLDPVVFLHRQDSSINFNRSWVDYRNGFGSPDTNYWMGLDLLHTLTSSKAYRLRVDMTDWKGKTLWAGYDRFSVGPKSSNYKLKVGGYDRYSTVTDEMRHHNGMMFSTYDRDNDRWSKGNCARDRNRGWWYKDCYFERPQVYTCQVVYVVGKVFCGGLHLAIIVSTIASNV